jgi:homoserine kinase
MLAVRAPATTANLGSGFDTFGAALTGPADVVRVAPADRTEITVTGSGAQYIPEDPADNVVGVVARELGVTAEIRIDKGVRPASGMGSSAASAAGAALALAELYDLPYTRRDLVPVAAEGEALVAGQAHADNVAPALLGGFTVVRSDGIVAVDAEVPLVVALPEAPISTSDARAVVPDRISMDTAVETVGSAATLVAGMCHDDPALVGRGMRETAVTPARAELIDGYDAARAAAEAAGATGVTVSGAGPAIVAACHPGDRRAVAAATVEAFDESGVSARAFQTAIGGGATVVER